MKRCQICEKEFKEGLYGFEVMFKNKPLMVTFDEQELCESCANTLSDSFDNATIDTNVAVVQNQITAQGLLK